MQQLDAQGPVVVDRITTQFADVTCSEDNARKLVEALHSGSEVTLTADGKTATFTPSVNLGYGEAYIALALAAEALRNAGVTGCASPEQWQAVLLGGPLTAAGTTMTSTSNRASASSSSSFPGILALRTQGQGWGQIAQTTNVQLGQVVSSARTSMNIQSDSDANLSPTGRSSAEFNRNSRANADQNKSAIPGSTDKSSTRDSSSSSSSAADSSTGSMSSSSPSSTYPSTSSDLSKGSEQDKDDNKSDANEDTANAGASSSSKSSDDSSSSSAKESDR